MVDIMKRIDIKKRRLSQIVRRTSDGCLASKQQVTPTANQ